MGREEKESGMVMIEAVYVTVIAIMLIFFVINVGVLYHNRIVVSAAADEAASAIASIYGRPERDPFYNYTDVDDFYTNNPYRYLFAGEEKYQKSAEKKAKWYASYLIYTQEFTADHKLNFEDIQVECKENELGAMSISVKAKRKYKVFVANPAAFFHLDPEYVVEAEGNAVCYDVLHQMNTTAFGNEMLKKIEKNTPLKYIGSILDFAEKFKTLWSKK